MSEPSYRGEIENLRQTVKFFEAMLRASADGVVITDATQSVVLVNEAFCDFLSRRPPDVIETSLLAWLEQLQPDSPRRWAELERRVHHEGACRDIEFQITTRDGRRHLSVNASLLERVSDEERGRIISIWRDVTERKRAEEELRRHRDHLEDLAETRTVELARTNEELRREITDRKRTEEALRESEERFRNLFDGISDGVAVYEAVDNGTDFVFLDYNPAGQKMDGVAKDDAVGRRVTEVFPGVEKLGLLDVLRRVWKTGIPEDHPVSVYEDGQVTFWRKNSVYKLPSGEIVAVYSDETERKRAEEELQESENKFRSITENAVDFIFIKDVARRYTFVNRAMQEILGLPEVEIIGKTPEEVFGSEQEFIIQEVDDRTFSGESVNETRSLVIGGKEVFFNTSQTPLTMKDGEVTSIMGIVRDVTDRKRAEQERERLIAELESKNAELERFTYTVSHDLRSPLVTINGFLGMLRQDAVAGNAEALEEDMTFISNATHKMEQLLDELMELSRIGRQGNPSEEIALTDLAQEVVSTTSGKLDERGIRVEISPDLPVVFGNRLRLWEVLQNLVDNAANFIGDQPDPQIEIGCRRDGEETVCYVRDNGTGIDPAYHEKVFGLFDRLDPKSKGTGVGLAVVKRVVEIHGGRIWVESEGPGQGSTFCFTIPRKREETSHERD